MKRTILSLSVAATLLFTACVSNPEGDKAETTDSVAATEVAADVELPVDIAKSTLGWTGRKVSGQHNGTVNITSGKLLLHEGKLSGGNFEFDLNTITVNDLSGDSKGKLESHLKSPDFFDVANHPKATFEITSVTPDTDSTITIAGNLTIRGVSKNITFQATTSEVSNTSVVANANFNIAREDWGVSYAGQSDDLISKEINLDIHLVASK